MVFKIEIFNFKFKTRVSINEIKKVDDLFDESFKNIDNFSVYYDKINNEIILEIKNEDSLYLHRHRKLLSSLYEDSNLLLNHLINLELRLQKIENNYKKQLK